MIRRSVCEAANNEVCGPTKFSILVAAPLFRDPRGLMMHRKFCEQLGQLPRDLQPAN
jgi:hypothetical protein